MSFLLGKISILAAFFLTSIGTTLGFVQPTTTVLSVPPQIHIASSSPSTKFKVKENDSYRTNGNDVGLSGAKQALGCTDEVSCKELCSKNENSEKCRTLFKKYNNSNQNNSQVNSNLSYEYSPRDCKNNSSPIFSHDITDVSKISSVYPPAHVIGGELKTRAYIHIVDRVPLYAPVDAVLVEGSYHLTVDGLAQYSLYFQVSCEVRFLFDHVSEPIDVIKKELPPTPSHDSRTSGFSHPITFKAGDLIGYTGSPAVGKTFDFGVFNNTLPNYFSTQPEFNNDWVYDYAVCPFNYFPQAKKSIYFTLFGDDSGPHTTPVELCK